MIRLAEGCKRLKLCAGLLWLALGVCACAPYVLEIDVAQQRLDVATPPLDGSYTVTQSFVCQRANLCQIELLPAVYDGALSGALTLRLDACGPGTREVARWSVSASQVRHNTPLLFSFAPQGDSAGRGYTLQVEGSPGARVGLWYNSVDAYGAGGLELAGSASPGDLYFTTRCRFDVPAVAQTIEQGIRPDAWLLFPLVVLLLVPGFVVRQGLGVGSGGDPVAGLALSLGLSLALVPVVWLWSTVAGLQWGRLQCWLLGGCLVFWLLLVLVRTRGRVLSSWFDARNRWLNLGASGLLMLTLLVRFVQVQDLVLPAWVDSPQHVLITQLLVTQGQVPHSYEPLLPVHSFVYHFGFHADAACFHWLSGLAIPQAMLVLGQVLNAAAALGAYSLTLRLTRRRTAALWALLIVGLVSYMPAYYVSWGRYTQLAGMVIAPVALVVSLEWLQSKGREPGLLLAAALLQAGLFMTHARVSVYAACFLASVWLCESLVHWLRRCGQRIPELSLRLGVLVLLALVLSAPWLAQVVGGIRTSMREYGVSSLAVDPSYNSVPQELLFVPRNAGLMLVAAVGALAGLWRRRRPVVWVLLWVGIVGLLLNPGWIGLAPTGLVNNATAVIALYLPLSVLAGEACTLVGDQAAALANRWEGFRRHGWRSGRMLLAAVLVGGALWGAWGMMSIVNPTTVLATQEDVPAMAWIRENTAADARFLINVRPWQLGTYVGTDAGYWIPYLTGRGTILPALSYTQGSPQYVAAIGERARMVHALRNSDDAGLRDLLREQGVTHVYIGAKGGVLTPQMFVRSSLYRPVYCTGQVWIFEVLDK